MQLSLVLSSLLALAAAQSSTAASSGSAAAPAPSLTPTQQCLGKCAAADVNCQAACVGVPHPGNDAMNQTTDCVAKCDQGDGTKEATDRYSQCRNQCISSYIILTGTAAPAAAASSASSAASGAVSSARASGSSVASAASSAAASASGAAASAARSAGAAAPTGLSRVTGAAGGLGLVFAAFAML